ncbi:TonB-linked SusC/RagA family outer membrane protein [Anseongella ginsenosidimutans]|uniref:TonB-linked SusC/RagA family outer membrane protein n=1 Tax=Anseongella ginsenosidimutans TaxID=496056 RepID=A0A4R3KSD6_9SPHI|nr:SusC/RagA family TonB-linked outer membrane protein [Anseongella ginsenosidimutans]QEC52951.1 SusC/RagA family TonB-linked outer membrane protein [Anseongella ginsenosidimutans]TCS87349.1 TonB-linked SusC/RagA family outer membrane protein [Anseongella ginsenosidimutans]
MKKSLLYAFLLVCSTLTAWSQEQTISGKVTGEDGAPLPGASVLVKGTSVGTSTDLEGEFTLDVPEGAIIEVSFIGFLSEEINTAGQSQFQVTLAPDIHSLEEVIVVGYGTATRQSFTGTATQIDAEALEGKSYSDVSKALAGEAAGVRIINDSGQPGESATIRIRGAGSVNGNRDPLYVVDGVPYTGNVNAINPADIESLTVLKDASATAIYGARGANGVIVINTKKGQIGKSGIEIDVKTGTNMSLLPRYNTLSSPEQYIGLSWEALYNRGTFGTFEEPVDPIAFANSRLFSEDGISPKYNLWDVSDASDLIDPATGEVRPDVTREYDPENWEDHAFNASNRTEANLRISGGSEKTSYFTSFGYLTDKGYAINTDFERISTRININHQVKDWLSGSLNLGYAATDMNNGGQTEDSGSLFWFVDNMPPIYPLFLRDEEGNRIPDEIYGGDQYDYGDGRGFAGLTNSIADTYYNIRNTKRHELNTNAFLKADITPNLSAEVRFGNQYFNSDNNQQDNPFYGSAASQGGSIFKLKTERLSYNFQQMLRYRTDIGEHHIDALAAHESNLWETKSLSASKFNMVDPGGIEFDNAVGSNPPESFTDKFTLESYFGQVNYDFKDTYFLSATVRRDGSSRFLKDKWGTFGSVGAAWLISNEAFMSNQTIFENLKLKASYGLIGEQGGVGYYPGYDLFTVSNLDGGISLAFDTKGNPDLTWETSKMFQAGVEFSLGKYLDGAIDYYVKNTDDLIFDRRVGPSIGYALIKVNDGALRNQGLEFNLLAHLVQNEDFYLDFGINGEMVKNKMTRMPIDPATNEEKHINIDGYYGQAKGHSIYDFYLREWAGVDAEDGRAMWNQYFYDTDGDGALGEDEEIILSLYDSRLENADRADQIAMTTTKNYTQATEKFIDKSAFPTVRGAFSLHTGYKGFELSAQFLYAVGGYAYDFVYARLMANEQIGNNNWHEDILNRWQEPGDITDVPRLSDDLDPNVGSSSSKYVTKASFLNLNNIMLRYTIPSQIVERWGVANLNIWVSGDNLWLLSERKGFNPSTNEAGESDWYRYSPLSTFTAGLGVRF